MTLTRNTLVGSALVGLLALGGCASGSGEAHQSPEEALSAAKTTLDKTSGVEVNLSTEKLPASVNGILTAEGVGTHDPAFKGSLKVATGGITADVPVVAAQGKVFAKLPFTTKFVEVDPSEYAAPDPAGLMEPKGGLSSLLTAAKDVEEGEQVRSGEDVLSSYTGTVPGSVVADIIPSASANASFDATFTVDDQDHLHKAVLTGPFYPKSGEVTYTITFDQYGTNANIALP
ncbi:MAG TPA: LppX_LprAFG lipoprotein [Nocardioidaceae bacterium]